MALQTNDVARAWVNSNYIPVDFSLKKKKLKVLLQFKHTENICINMSIQFN